MIKGASGGEHPLTKTFLALGYSYTWGEGVIEAESFPFQLAAKLDSAGVDMEIPHIIYSEDWVDNYKLGRSSSSSTDGR
jgi:hypothetical protein